MSARQGGLGRGLSSLIPKKNNQAAAEVNYFGSQASASPVSGDDSDKKVSQKTAVPSDSQKKQSVKNIQQDQKISDIALKSVMEISVDKIIPNPHQPRQKFDEQKLEELASSIKKYGIIKPIVVSRLDDGNYELVAGERRLKASKLAGMEKVPVLVKDVNEEEKMEIALIENIQRHNLDVIEEARAYKKMQDYFNLTQDEIAKRVGKGRSTVANTLRLLDLPMEIQRAVTEGKISEGHARTILAVGDVQKQMALFQLILKNELNVRQAEDKAREVSVSSHKRKIKDKDPEIAEKESVLETTLGTKVRIKESKGGGQILVDFYSKEELSNLFNKLTSS